MERKVKTLEEISASVTRYYDTLTEEERAENLAWGQFAETQFPAGSDCDSCGAKLSPPHSK